MTTPKLLAAAKAVYAAHRDGDIIGFERWADLGVAIMEAEALPAARPTRLSDAAMSLAHLVDEWTARGWNADGRQHAGNIWLGRDGNGACFETDVPTHYRPLPAPPVQGDAT